MLDLLFKACKGVVIWEDVCICLTMRARLCLKINKPVYTWWKIPEVYNNIKCIAYIYFIEEKWMCMAFNNLLKQIIYFAL